MYVLYGAGIDGRRFVKRLYENDFSVYDITIVDSDQRKWDGANPIEGLVAQNPESVMKDKDAIDKVIVTISSRESFEEIKECLTKKYNFDASDVIWFLDAAIIPDVINLGYRNLSLGGHRIVTNEECIHMLNEALGQDEMNDLQRFFIDQEHNRIIKDYHYLYAYDEMFNHFRDLDEVKILEIGVAGGGSMQMWKEYFSAKGASVQVFGIDILPECIKYQKDGIKIFIGSQEDTFFLDKVKREIGKVDIIIDDGGHTMNQQIVSYESLFEILSDDGVYLCEDCSTSFSDLYGGNSNKTWIEYSKRIVDGFYKNMFKEFKHTPLYSDDIGSVTFYPGMVFINKRRVRGKSLTVISGRKDYE